jgi:signal peptidase II
MIRFCSLKSTRLVLALAILLSCVGCDQATKRIATEALCGAPPRSYLANCVHLEYALNPGGFLSLGSQFSPDTRFWMFTIINLVLLAVVAGVLVKSWNMRLTTFIAILFFLAGGLGNMVDRVLHEGLVTDFIVLSIGPLRTGVFNIADVAITCGGLFCVLAHRASMKSAPAA